MTADAREEWSSESAFVFSMAAAAVGLGNLWRFPYMVGENGGGAFIVAYLAALLVVVLPLMLLEVAAGRLSQGNTVKTFRSIHPLAGIYGWFVVGITFVVTSYYIVITGWTLGYFIDSLRGELRQFEQFTVGYNSLIYFLIVIAVAWLVLVRGLAYLERLSRILMPLLVAVIVGLVWTASESAGWGQAKRFLLETDPGRLRDTNLWLMAFGQAFYSLAIGQGYLVTYGSHIPRETHLPRASGAVAITETSVALLSGFMIFPFVFAVDLAPDTGSQLAFSTLPLVFEDLASGRGIGVVFFLLFFAAALSSALAGLKVVTSAVGEEFSLRDRAAVTTVIAVISVVGVPSALSFTPVEFSFRGLPFLEWVDQLVGTNVILFSGVFGAALLCWTVPAERIHSSMGSRNRWWVWRIYSMGRWLPVAVASWLLATRLLGLTETA